MVMVSGMLVVTVLFNVSAMTVIVPGELAPQISVFNSNMVHDHINGMSGDQGNGRVMLPLCEAIDEECPD